MPRTPHTKAPAESGSSAPKVREIVPTMVGALPSAYLTRDSILELLSDDEVSSVSTAETQPGLASGDDFIDLHRLERGVQRAHGAKAPMGDVIPRKSVRPQTWEKIVSRLTMAPASRGLGRV
jgi:hypothetical protein